MFKRVLHGSGAAGALTVAYLLGSVTLGGALAQSGPPTTQAAQQDQQPAYTSSITVPQDQASTGEQDEAAALASQAKVSSDQARAAALAQFPGATIQQVELDNEDGSLVYSVQLADSAGKTQEVKVDAGTGQVLQVQADGPEGPEAGGPED